MILFTACLAWLVIVAIPIAVGLHVQARRYGCQRTRAVALTLDMFLAMALLTLVVLANGG